MKELDRLVLLHLKYNYLKVYFGKQV